MKYYQDTSNKKDKIPYDKEPIYREQSTSRSKNKSSATHNSKLLALVVCFLLVFNVILSSLVIKLVKDSKNNPSQTNIYNIETNGTFDVSAVADKTRPSAVVVHAGANGSVNYSSFFSMSSKGAGVILHGNKETGEFYILTCYHVVKRYVNEIYVLLNDSFTPLRATLVTKTGYSLIFDIAVLRVVSDEYKRSNASACEIAPSSLARDGEGVIAYGNPQGGGLTVTSGEISKVINIITVDQIYSRLLKTSAPINAGNSGGGLFNAKGELIGIVNAKINDNPNLNSYVDNIAYAIPSDVAVGIAENIIRNGKPLRIQTGLKFAIANNIVSYDLVDGKLIPNQTIVVTKVEAGSPAELAGIKVGDEIVSFSYNNKTVAMRNLYSFEDHIFNIDAPSNLTFKVKRNGAEAKDYELKIVSAEAADNEDWYRNW